MSKVEGVISGEALMGWLAQAGVDVRLARRVIIDATVQEAVTIYVERYATNRLIEAEAPADLATAAVEDLATTEIVVTPGISLRGG